MSTPLTMTRSLSRSAVSEVEAEHWLPEPGEGPQIGELYWLLSDGHIVPGLVRITSENINPPGESWMYRVEYLSDTKRAPEDHVVTHAYVDELLPV